jgi:hypothetical protein
MLTRRASVRLQTTIFFRDLLPSGVRFELAALVKAPTPEGGDYVEFSCPRAPLQFEPYQPSDPSARNSKTILLGPAAEWTAPWVAAFVEGRLIGHGLVETPQPIIGQLLIAPGSLVLSRMGS